MYKTYTEEGQIGLGPYDTTNPAGEEEYTGHKTPLQDVIMHATEKKTDNTALYIMGFVAMLFLFGSNTKN